MRAIRSVQIDKVRPAVILTREYAVGHLSAVVVAPITSTVHGTEVEVPVGQENGLDHGSVINCDGITSVRPEQLKGFIGFLTESQDEALTAAIIAAFELI